MERCRECSGRRISFATARAGYVYAGPAPLIVRAWKERGLRRLGVLVADLVAERVAAPAADVIAAVPPDPVRQLRRSRHPAECLAADLGRRWDLPCHRLLVRTRTTERQASLSRALRGANARGSFAAIQVPPRSVLLVDDVYTTGSTAAAAATALRAAGASRVDVVTFARAVR